MQNGLQRQLEIFRQGLIGQRERNFRTPSKPP